MKEQQIDEFGELLHNILWMKKPNLYIQQLEKLILTKRQFDFSKDEFIDWYISNLHFPKPSKLDYFIFHFLSECYDAVTFETSDHSTIQLIRKRIFQLNKLIK